jgi:BASS family bile acid:Na+ symporter
MQELLTKTLPLVALAFLTTSMFNVGLDLRVRQIIEPLRDRVLLSRALLASVILIPLLAAALTRVFPMEHALATGLIVYALSAGTEGGPKFVQLARGNAGFAVGLLAVLLTITIVCMPVALSFVVPDAHVDRVGLLVKLLLAVALPLGIGLLLRARTVRLADRLSAVMHPVTLGLLGVFFVQVVYVNADAIMKLPAGALIAALLYFVIAFGIGFGLGGPRNENRRALGMMGSVRNAPIAMTTASQVFAHEPAVLVMVTLMAALSFVYAVLCVVVMKRFSGGLAPAQGSP